MTGTNQAFPLEDDGITGHTPANPAADGGGVPADRAFPLEDDGIIARASASSNAFPLEDDGIAAHPEDRAWRVPQVGVPAERR